MADRFVNVDGVVKVAPFSAPVLGNKTAVDYFSCTFPEQFVMPLDDDPCPDDLMNEIIELLESFFQRPLGSKVGYQQGFKHARLVDDIGHIACKGSNGRCYISLSGHAFAIAPPSFCDVFYTWLSCADGVNVTRVDIAFDDFDGLIFSPRQARSDYDAGLFAPSRGVSPVCRQAGDYIRDDPDRKGLTTYIGSRIGGKMLRIYEKGRQLGDKDSGWVRAEVEFRGSIFQIPLSVLISPDGFFVGAYSYLSRIAHSGDMVRMDRQKKEADLTLESLIHNIRLQYGGHLYSLRNGGFFESDKDLLNAVCRKPSLRPQKIRAVSDLNKAAGIKPTRPADLQAIPI